MTRWRAIALVPVEIEFDAVPERAKSRAEYLFEQKFPSVGSSDDRCGKAFYRPTLVEIAVKNARDEPGQEATDDGQ